ncbi:hypothetical protein N7451_012365 [Penicillium sp. IBT 35674x]|nr:hypothetical protein N7451_012365 [Penicillium sp. IBT 35674x]
MQFTWGVVGLVFATLATALPQEAVGNGMQSQDHDAIRWRVPDGMTVQEAQTKCGDQAQLSCCNKATYAGDTTDVNSGLGSGLLSHLLGTGSGAAGAGIFDQCSKLNVQVAAVIAVPIKDILNQRCKQNIACCARSPHESANDLVGASLPCIALGSIL